MADLEHRVLRLWVRPTAGAPVEERDHLVLKVGHGVEGDHTAGSTRQITLLFEEEWHGAEEELGRSVDPSGRRANVLLSGGGGSQWIGKTVALGTCHIAIQGETKPCFVMDQAADGLMDALEGGRAGIWGRIEQGGTLRVGEESQLLSE
ncbi:MAG: MOSC domain-containing protein [Planctomycetota bacterium]|nr:MOSC domain-containing protein [Planctomycetota bacterium]